MFHILTKEESESLKHVLFTQLPESAKMYCNISNHLDKLLPGFEVIVDQWPRWTSIILRPNCPELVPRYFKNYHICHTRSTKDFIYFIQRPGVIDWTQPAIFTGIPYDAVGVIQEKSRKEHGEVMSVENRFMYCWTRKDPPDPEKINEDLQFTSLKLENADALCLHWKHARRNTGLQEYYQRVIENFESSAIVTPEGQLVGYVCMQFNGSMANLWVHPDFRKCNLGVALLCDLTRKLIAKGQTAYGFIKTEDSVFINTCQKIGFSWVPQGSMSWLHYKPKGLPLTKSWPKELSLEGATKDEKKDDVNKVYLNAMPLSCNECLEYKKDITGIAQGTGTECVHVVGS